MRTLAILATFVLAAAAACDTTDDAADGGAGSGGGGNGGHPSPDGGPDAGPDAGPDPACSLPAEPGSCRAYLPRYHHDPATGTCERFVYGGCGGNANNYATLPECEAACGVLPRSTECQVEATDPSLPGVRVRIEGDRCRLPIEQMHAFRYSVQLDEAITYTAPGSGGACGRCGGYTTDPLSLLDYAIEGGGHRYCECDVGCCPPTTPVERTLQTGTFERELEWSGYEWNGPSDTNAPVGPPFPPGGYAVRVSFAVPDVGTITAVLPIELFVPPGAGSDEAGCSVGGRTYASREGGIPDPVSCNTCNCFDGDLACTDADCPEPCPDGTAYGKSCARCGPTDACEVVRHDCLPSCETDEDCAEPSLWFCAAEGVCKNVCG